jgi:hypothetical protein
VADPPQVDADTANADTIASADIERIVAPIGTGGNRRTTLPELEEPLLDEAFSLEIDCEECPIGEQTR